MAPIRVLHVGHESDSSALTAPLQDDRFDVVTETSVEGAVERLAEGSPDCVLGSHDATEMGVVAFVERVREIDPETPLIVRADGDVASAALEAGATDYVHTDGDRYREGELATRIEHAVAESGRQAVDTESGRQSETDRRLERLRTVFDLVPDPVFVKDEDGTFVLVNEAFAESYGLTPDELEGKTESYVETDERARRFREKDREILDRDEPELVYEDAFSDDEGNRRYHQTTKIPFELPDGRPAVLGHAREVTTLKQYELELERKTEYLEQFARVVSHDLRNPLAVAKSRLELAKEECNSDHLAHVDQSLTRMEAIVDDTLRLAQEGETVGKMDDVDLGVLAREGWAEVETEEATLEVDSTAEIRCDRGRARHVFENLFQNAVTHGGGAVTVRVGTIEGGFYVEDDGQGLPEIDLNVFEAGETTTENGTGFGLSIVERIATAHGWEFEVTDGAEGGARFEFTGVDGAP